MTLRAQMWFLWLSSWVLRCIMKPFILLRYIRRRKKLPPIHSKLLLHSATKLAHMIRTRQVRIPLAATVCRFCCCMTMQDRTLLAQRLMLWRRWNLRFSPIRPTALTWRQAISISLLAARGISRGLISPQMMKWSKLWRRRSNKELLNSSLTACVNLFYVGKNVLNDKATMSKNKYVNL